MRILLHSNAPTVPSGYGVQVALLADRLASDGHEVAVSCTWGHQVGVTTWTSPSGHKIRLYPGVTASGDDVIHQHALHFFGGNPRGGWIIPLIDVWSMSTPVLAEFNVAAWAPVDHDPVPPGVLAFFDRSKATPIAMSEHGRKAYQNAGLTPLFAPLMVDTSVYRPTWTVHVDGRDVSAREFFHLPNGAFVVGMVAMNKDANDRKGFDVAIQAFAEFHARHPQAILFIHTERYGMFGGINLPKIVESYGLDPSAVVFTEEYAYRIGFTPEIMAALYTSLDVLLCPSAGEGFGVPMVEAQACGVPVIASPFTAQTELLGAGWSIDGQRQWDEASRAHYFRASASSIVDALERAIVTDLDEMQSSVIAFASRYDADLIYRTHWRPILAELSAEPDADKPLMDDIAVIVPMYKRTGNIERLTESFEATNDGTARLYFIVDDEDEAVQGELLAAYGTRRGWTKRPANRGSSFACKVNAGYAQTDESFVFLCGDDVEFTPGWIEAARKLSDRYDVIGTNDSEPGRTRNPKVAAGKHADHFFVRRSYVEEQGSSLEGPGILMAEAYYHFFGDVELIQLARARGVFAPCLESRVIHHHPGYDGREDLRQADPSYRKAVEFSEMDAIAFRRRAGLIDHLKTVREDIWL